MSHEINKTEKTISHPLEEVFDIEENTTIVPHTEVKTDLIPYEPYDEKDRELEEQFQDLYDLALEAFESQQDDMETVEPKYKARNAEVAVQYLRAALDAAKEKTQMKQHKDKVVTTSQSNSASTTNNLVVTHSELLKLLNDKDEKPVNTFDQDGTPVED